MTYYRHHYHHITVEGKEFMKQSAIHLLHALVKWFRMHILSVNIKGSDVDREEINIAKITIIK